jgi:importin subunit alpha-1
MVQVRCKNDSEHSAAMNEDIQTASEAEQKKEVPYVLQRNDIPGLAEALNSNSLDILLQATTILRKMVSPGTSKNIKEIVDAGVIPKFVQLLENFDSAALQFEVSASITIITIVDCMDIDKPGI